MCDIAFVILHYLGFTDTCECVESIKKNVGTDNYRIIIVDNNSPDDSFSKLNDEYSSDERIVLIHNNENCGFARGNNIGFRYARDELQASFIVLANNDTCLFQRDFYPILRDSYLENHFAVMGPMIITRDGSCKSNPFGEKALDETETKALIRRNRLEIILYKTRLFKIYHFMQLVFLKLFKKKNKHSFRYDQKYENVKLHGSFLVFSKDYTERYNGLDESTFLYFEEEILYYTLMKDGMKTLYDPSISIYHKEDVSTEYSLGKGNKKEVFMREMQLDSMEYYLSLLK